MTLANVGFPEALFFTMPLLFLVGLVVLGVLLIGKNESTPTATGSALRVLEERYARGEITREEFIERREVLRGQNASS